MFKFNPLTDQQLFNTGFLDGFRAASLDDPNLFWATPEQAAGNTPVTLATNKEFLASKHPDRVFAEAALIGIKAFESGKTLEAMEPEWKAAAGIVDPSEAVSESSTGELQQSPPKKK